MCIRCSIPQPFSRLLEVIFCVFFMVCMSHVYFRALYQRNHQLRVSNHDMVQGQEKL